MIVLAIGAHPDDIELGCGGTLVKHHDAGDEVHILVLTNGEGGNAPPRIRRAEAVEAAGLMGVTSLRFGDLHALEMCYVRQAHVEVIERAIAVIAPDRVYCHSEHDLHQNHVTAARCSLIAAKRVGEVLSFRLPSKTGDFRPTYYVDVSDVMNKKLECIAAFETQSEKDYMSKKWVDGVALGYAIDAGSAISSSAAEAFFVERMVWE